ncbi:uncharacterized protein RAG0_12464 [Rhynchosporium agropyri]|uniref:F-box domain protein n=1 Tax=Rhynchosporium agropyri TaxID=914238 RepID=A0A1E1L8K4_9HELO|nr:uncharacterized protein RAG0_12464 [Rhynchosporium agropyri]
MQKAACDDDTADEGHHSSERSITNHSHNAISLSEHSFASPTDAKGELEASLEPSYRSNMASAPPSYQAAAYGGNRKFWLIVAPYVHSYDLYRACLVCRQWHQLFAPFLWGDPARKFGVDDDNIYLNLTRFKRRLTQARLEVRRLSHTLHIPPAQPEFYDGPQAGWLCDILDRLPCLQALIVSNLTFFDHSSLQGIHQRGASIVTYPLKLLIASNCKNTTASSLTTALLHFPELVYLDLSATQGVRSPYVLRQIGTLTELRVLKLRACGLRDDDVDHLSFSGLRSLDISCNLLTERGLAKLFAKLPTIASRRGNLSPLDRRYSGVPLPLRVIAEGLDRFIVKRLTSGIDGYLGVEEGLPSAFSHLDVDSNFITIDSLSHLAGNHNLQHLNCGSLNLSQKPYHPTSPGAARRSSDPIIEVEILQPSIFKHTFRDLRYLRIHHSLVTSQSFSGKDISLEKQCFELHEEDLRFELDSTEIGRPVTFELDDTSVVPPQVDVPVTPARFESPEDVGASLHTTKPILGSANGRELKPSEQMPQVRVTFADEEQKSSSPITISSNGSLTAKDHPPSLESSSEMDTQMKIMMPDEMKTLGSYWDIVNSDKGRSTSKSTPSPLAGLPQAAPIAPPLPPRSTPDAVGRIQNNYQVETAGPPFPRGRRNIQKLLSESLQRLQVLTTHHRHPGRFKPSYLPSLKSLTLTSIPSTTHRHCVPDTLSLLIRELAEEEEIARLQEHCRYTIINQPPPQHPPTRTLNLKHLVLDMTSHPDPVMPLRPKNSNSPTARELAAMASKKASFTYTKSSTEDPDSESFMQSIDTDFSFFGEDDGGLLVSEGRIDSPNMRTGKDVDYGSGTGEGGGDEGEGKKEKVVDVVKELSAFRRARKNEFERAEEQGVWGVEEVLGGYWRGEVKVVREAGG